MSLSCQARYGMIPINNLYEGGMPVGSLTNSKVLACQYGTSDKLNTRISIHDKYSTNKQGFGNWIT